MEVGPDPLEGKTALDFAPDPPPENRHCVIYAPYPEYKVGDYSLAGIVSTRNRDGKLMVWAREEGGMSRKDVEEADFLRCDHCNTRRHRKALLFFENEAGERLQIGTKCSKVYFGVNLEAELRKVSYALSDALAGEVSDNCYGGGSGLHPIEYTLPVAVFIVKRDGYMSLRKADERFNELPTSHTLSFYLHPMGGQNERLQEERRTVLMAAFEDEKEVMAAFEVYKAETLEKKDKNWSEFLHNLTENFSYPTLGMAAYMAYEMVGKKAERAKRVPSKCLERELSTKMADLGDFTVTMVREENGIYGESYFHVVKSEVTGETVMFRRSVDELEVGDKITLRGKVKIHLDTATVVGYPKIKGVEKARSDEERAKEEDAGVVCNSHY